MKKKYQSLTNKEQSEKLISLGIKPETADFILVEWECGSLNIKMTGEDSEDEEIIRRLWTISRLLEMMPEEVCKIIPTPCGTQEEIWYDRTICGTSVEYSIIDCDEGKLVLIDSQDSDLFTNIINIIEWLIKSKQLDQDYLIS